jgi:phosphatidylglycerol---prolipoprotein diacylglyceryl transferase
MTFPVYFHLLGYRLHPHPVMEVIGYTAGFQLYLLLRRRWPRAVVPFEQNMWILVGAIFGALAGSKLLAWIESWPDYLHLWQTTRDLSMFDGGKTIVGGLLGGWIGVEIAKKIVGVRFSTGDLYVFPLIVGMSIGRVGCFLTGLPDHTYGDHTTLPWAVDFGDGPRHPTQLYDIVFLMLLGITLLIRMRRPHANGRIFRFFICSYCAYRFAVEFIKPTYRPYLGLSAIQITCAFAVIICLWLLYHHRPDDIAQPTTARAPTA